MNTKLKEFVQLVYSHHSYNAILFHSVIGSFRFNDDVVAQIYEYI